MKHQGFSVSTAYGLAITIVSLTLACGGVASAQTAETTLYTFGNPPDGEFPVGPVVFDKAGNIYGSTSGGGPLGYGAVFELSPEPAGGCPSGSSSGNGWCETILHLFAGNGDGIAPSSGLIIDSKGALYGETAYGGDANGVSGGSDSGMVFKLTPPAAQGGQWSESILYSFCSLSGCADGGEPQGGLVFDKDGNLYGTASGGGLPETEEGYGAVFELIKPSGNGTVWKETVLYDFLGSYDGNNDGQHPGNGVVFDKAGNLYGTTYYGGDYSACINGAGSSCGTVFELPYNGGAYGSESILYAFQGTTDGAFPTAGLVLDKSGALYGTTPGDPYNSGNVFKLSPPTVEGGPWAESVPYTFLGLPSDGSGPAGGVIFDGENLYGTTEFGGGGPMTCNVNGFFIGCGTVFKLAPPKSGSGAWTETILWDIPGNVNGVANAEIWPTAGLTLKGASFYGAAAGAPNFSGGGVFELSPAAATTTSLTSAPNPSTYGQAALFTATVASSAGAPPDGEIVSFKQGTTVLGTGTLSSGTATFTDSALTVGTKSIKAVYGGDADFLTSTSTAVSQVIGIAMSTTALTSSANPSSYEQPVTFTATVSPQFSGTPTGSVTFYNGTAALGTVTLNNGTASYTTTKLAVGTESITAGYKGSSSFSASTSAALSQVVNPASTTTTLVSSLNPSNFGQSVTFTATVAAQFGGTVIGSVTFMDGATTLKTVNLEGGTAKYTTSSLALGIHDITATYNGATDFVTSSDSITQTVN